MLRAKLMIIALVATFGVMTVSATANAAVVIDQDAIVPPNPSVGPPAGRLAAIVGNLSANFGSPLTNGKVIQTITAGVGGILNTIDLQGPFFIGDTSLPLFIRLSLWDGNAFAGTGSLVGFQDSVFGSLSLPNNRDSQVVVSFDLSSFNYAVTPGQLFSITIEAPSSFATAGAFTIGNFLGFDGNNQPIIQPNQYAGGALYASAGSSPYSLVPADLGFRTYVAQSNVAAVPEPAVWLMMLGGFFIVGTSLRRRTDVRIDRTT